MITMHSAAVAATLFFAAVSSAKAEQISTYEGPGPSYNFPTYEGPPSNFENSLGTVNQCYHGVSQSDPCIGNALAIASIIAVTGRWKAVRNSFPWTLEFHPNGIFDIEHGTLAMSTIGPAKGGKYRLESQEGNYPTIFIDMDDGRHIKASIALYGIGELLLMDQDGTTTFHRQ